jgi:hypothetical protein
LWTYRGSAYRDENGSYLVLTEPVWDQTGIVWLNVESSSTFIAQFRIKIGRAGGGDGLVFLFYKTKDYEPQINSGTALGFTSVHSDHTGGIAEGYGVEFDNVQFLDPPSEFGSGVDPSHYHIAMLKDHVMNHLVYVNHRFDNMWHDVEVKVGMETVDVMVDGKEVISWEGELDRTHSGMGFSAATGALTNWHLIDDVKILLNDYIVPQSACQDLYPELWDIVNAKFRVAEALFESTKREKRGTTIFELMKQELENAENAQKICDLESAAMHLDWIIQAAPEPFTLAALLILPLCGAWRRTR